MRSLSNAVVNILTSVLAGKLLSFADQRVVFVFDLLTFIALFPAMSTENLILAFGTEKGTGAAFLLFSIAVPGILACLIFSRDRHIWELEE